MKRGCAFATVLLFALAGRALGNPEITVDPIAIAFGRVFVGSSALRSLKITNTGDAELEVTAISMSNGDAPPKDDFDIPILSGGLPPAFPVTIAAGGSVMFAVVYSPSNVGVDGDAVEVESNDPDNGHVAVNLSGEGIPQQIPEINVTPADLSYGARFLGTGSSRAINVKNEGTGVLSVPSVVLSGPSRSQFTLAGAPGVTGARLDPGESLTVTATYRPNQAGRHSASVVVTSNDADEASVSVTLTGTGLQEEGPSIVVSPLSVDFGDVFVGASSTQPVSISNDGTLPLTVSGVALAEGSDPSFSLGEITLPIELAPGASTSIDAIFTPGEVGAVQGALVIESNDDDTPAVNVSLAGEGTPTPAPDITVETDPTLPFGQVQVGTSETRTARIRNTGVAILDVTSIALSGGTSAEFTYDGPASLSLVPGAELPLPVTYAPVDQGFDGGTLVIASEDPDEAVIEVALSGSGVADASAKIDVRTDPVLAYGQVSFGASIAKVVSIANAGAANLDVTAIALGQGTSADYAITDSPVLPVSIAPGARVEVEVTYTPASDGFDSGTVVIESADPVNPTSTVSLTGIGINNSNGVPQIEVEPEILEFGAHPFGSPVSLGVTVRNRGTAELQVTSVRIGEQGSLAFSVAEPTQFSLVPDSEAVVNVTFTPTPSPGDKSNVLIIESNDVANPVVNVTLIGASAPRPQIATDPEAVDFGDVEIGSSTTLAVTVQSIGGEPLNVTAIALGAGSSAAFTLAAPDPGILDPGTETTFDVTYAPTEEVTDTGAVEISSNDVRFPLLRVSLTGTGVPVAVMGIRVAPRSLEFGAALVGTAVTKELTIRNVGTDALELSGVVIGDGSSVTFDVTDGPGDLTVAPRSETTVKVTYTPLAPKADSGTIRIASNDYRRPLLKVSLFGFGTGEADAAAFRRGDANADGAVDISDVAKTLNYLFSGGSAPSCLDAADFNDDGDVDISDGLFTLTRLFGGGVAALLADRCEADETDDALPLCRYSACD